MMLWRWCCVNDDVFHDVVWMVLSGWCCVDESSKCCICHAKRAGDAPSDASATQNEAAPKVINRRRPSADFYQGAPSAAPATQNDI